MKPFVLLLLATVAVFSGETSQISDAVFERGYERVFESQTMLLREGGAKVIELKGVRYFVAAGVTTVGAPTPSERLRQLKVGRINALKQAVEFTNSIQIRNTTNLTETTEITQRNGTKSAMTTKSLDETTLAELRGVLKAPPQVASWKSADGQLFFYAIGIQIK